MNAAIAKMRYISAMAIFGTIGLFVRYIELPSAMIAMMRGWIGMFFLLAVVALRGGKISRQALRKNAVWLLFSGIALGVNWILLFEAYHYTTIATATLCYYFAPIFLVLAAPILFKERLTKRKLFCVVMALVGMVFVSGVLQEGIHGIAEIKGIMLGIGAAVFYATVILLNKQMKEISAEERTIVQLGITAVILFPYILLTENIGQIQPTVIMIIMLFLVGIVHTGIAYVLYFGAMKDMPAQSIAVFSYMDPIVAVLLSALILREPMGIFGAVGAGLVLIAALVSELPEK